MHCKTRNILSLIPVCFARLFAPFSFLNPKILCVQRWWWLRRRLQRWWQLWCEPTTSNIHVILIIICKCFGSQTPFRPLYERVNWALRHRHRFKFSAKSPTSTLSFYHTHTHKHIRNFALDCSKTFITEPSINL